MSGHLTDRQILALVIVLAVLLIAAGAVLGGLALPVHLGQL